MAASQSTMDKLYSMRMSVMAQAYRDQGESPGIADMTFDERFSMIVDAEWDARRVNKRTRLLRQAGFSSFHRRDYRCVRIHRLLLCVRPGHHTDKIIPGLLKRAAADSRVDKNHCKKNDQHDHHSDQSAHDQCILPPLRYSLFNNTLFRIQLPVLHLRSVFTPAEHAP